MIKEWAYVPEDIYRSGNSTSPRLEHVKINQGPDKDDDVATSVINGITYVYPDSGGISAFNIPVIYPVKSGGFVMQTLFCPVNCCWYITALPPMDVSILLFIPSIL
jgi:hypothetical protein